MHRLFQLRLLLSGAAVVSATVSLSEGAVDSVLSAPVAPAAITVWVGDEYVGIYCE